MNCSYIFKTFYTIHFLLLQSLALNAMEINKSHYSDINTNVLRSNTNNYKKVSGDIVFDQGNKKKYPIFNFDNYELNLDKDSNIRINPYNTFELNASKIVIDSNIYCSGNININLDNNSQLIINNNKNFLNLLEMGANILLDNNSSIIFNNIDDKNVFNLFSNPKSKTNITLLNGSTINFNKNVILRLTQDSKILINNGILNCSNSKINLNKGSKIISRNGGTCSFNDSECNLNRCKIVLNESSQLHCNNTKVESKNSDIALDKASNITTNNASIKLQADKIELNNNSIVQCTKTPINSSKNTTLKSLNSRCKFDESILNLGDSIINILGDDTNNTVHFEMQNSLMQSNSFDFQFNINALCHMLVKDSRVECLGKLVKLNSSAQSEIPLVTIEGKSYFIWSDLDCDQGYDIQIADESIVLIVNKLLYDDLNSSTPEIEQDNEEQEEEVENRDG